MIGAVDTRSQVTTIFQNFHASLEQEQLIREEVRKITKELETHIRKITTSLQQIHNPRGEKLSGICERSRGPLPEVSACFAKLRTFLKPEDYVKYHDHWKGSTQQLTTHLAVIVWLERNVLVSPIEIETAVGASGLGLELEDFLIGLSNVPSELARLCVNSVITGDFAMPLRIVKFVEELYAGFRLLNLKNDYLRKRYDSIKYDLKKIEEVVYDITIRKLAPVPPASVSREEKMEEVLAPKPI